MSGKSCEIFLRRSLSMATASVLSSARDADVSESVEMSDKMSEQEARQWTDRKQKPRQRKAVKKRRLYETPSEPVLDRLIICDELLLDFLLDLRNAA